MVINTQNTENYRPAISAQSDKLQKMQSLIIKTTETASTNIV